MRISDWSSDVCSSDLEARYDAEGLRLALARPGSLRIAAFGATTPLQLQAPLAFAVDRLELEAAPEDGGYRYRLGAREDGARFAIAAAGRSEEHTSELQPLMRSSYAVFCLKKKKTSKPQIRTTLQNEKQV